MCEFVEVAHGRAVRDRKEGTRLGFGPWQMTKAARMAQREQLRKSKSRTSRLIFGPDSTENRNSKDLHPKESYRKEQRRKGGKLTSTNHRFICALYWMSDELHAKWYVSKTYIISLTSYVLTCDSSFINSHSYMYHALL